MCTHSDFCFNFQFEDDTHNVSPKAFSKQAVASWGLKDKANLLGI